MSTSEQQETVRQIEDLERWEAAGGVLSVETSSGTRLVLTMLTCDGGTEMGRVSSTDPALRSWWAARAGESG